jgi:glycolate oxidase iron-sulfur subunit
VDHARAHIEKTYQRPWGQKLMRALLASILPYRERFRLALAAAFFAKPFAPAIGALPGIGPNMRAMLKLAPARFPVREAVQEATSATRRVIILEGCAQPVLRPSINAAARRLLARHGIAVVTPKGEGCCGALVHHMGREHDALQFARANIDAWCAELDRGAEAILITASGCGTSVKDYGFLLREDPAYAEKAARVSAATRDITEFVLELPALKPARTTGQVVAYHSACSMQHGQKITDGPKRLLRDAGFQLRDVPEGHICCGSAGTYNILQPDFADRLRARKVGNIEKVKPQIIATGNIGCITQISQGTRVPIVHTVELLDWAAGGPAPIELRAENL